MKALLYADWRTVSRDILKYALCALVIGAVFVFSEDTSDPNAIAADIEAAIMSCVTFYYCTFFLFSTFTSDAAAGWEVSRLSLPVSRRDVVRARYAFLALTAVVAVIAGAILGAVGTVVCEVSNHIGNTVTLADPVDLLIGGASILGIALIIISIELPLFFWLGHEKARPLVTLPFLLPLLLLYGPVKDFLNSIVNPTDAMHAVEGFFTSAGPAIFLVVAVVILVASSMLSTKLYERRDL